MNPTKNKIEDAFLGLAVGDALGVPVEFFSREELRHKPVSGMLSFGTHHQPAGTWSDDSSLSFCLAESLIQGYNLENLAQKFIDWYEKAHWTAHQKVFDVGIQTREAILRLKNSLAQGKSPLPTTPAQENQNGNGSLMRIMPLAFYLMEHSIEEQFFIISQVSALTHAHIRSQIACFIYIRLAIRLLRGQDKFAAYEGMQFTVRRFLKNQGIAPQEIAIFDRLLNSNIAEVPAQRIQSSGYVVHTLEAAIWCLLRHDSFSETVLKAVNLGEDTDTTAAVTGALAGIIYGKHQIPSVWLDVLARKEDILDLANNFYQSLVPNKVSS